MNDLAMQNERPVCRTMVRDLPAAWLGHPHPANQPKVRGWFSHPVKAVVRLVSFSCPAFEMTWLQHQDALRDVASSTASFTAGYGYWRPRS